MQGKPNSFQRNVFMVISGTAISQIVSLVASLVIARLYSPADMGLYNHYNSIFTMFAVAACLQIEMAIVLPEKDSEARQIHKVTQAIALTIAAISVVLVLAFREQTAALLNADGLQVLLLLLPVSILLEGLHKGYRYLLVRANNMKSVATANALTAVTSSGSQIALGVKPIALKGGMVFGTIIGHIVQNLYMHRKAKQLSTGADDEKLTVARTKQILSRYRNFPLYSGPAVFMDSMSTSLPGLMLGMFYNSTVVGCYALCYRVLSMPVSIISGSIAQAYLPEAVKYKKDGTLGKKSLELAMNLMRLGFTPMLLITIAAKPLMDIFFGVEWVTSSMYMRCLGLWLALTFVYSPLSFLFSVTEHLKEFSKLRLVILVGRALALVLGGLFFPPVITMAVFGVCSAVLAAGSIAYALKQAGVKIGVTLTRILKELLHSGIYLLPTALAIVLFGDGLVSLAVAVLSGIVFLGIEGLRKLKAIKGEKRNGEA